MKRVNVEVWSDFVCPWCWIAKHRFEKAVQRLDGQVEVFVTHKSYRLAKGKAPADFKEVLIQKLGADSAERMMVAVGLNGKLEGLTYNFDTMQFGDTSDAHALVKCAGTPKQKQQIIERLFQAATTDGINIFDRDVLVSLAWDLGISEASIDFDSSKINLEISHDELRANMVANGVPLFIFNEKFHLSGARDVEAFEKALLDAAIDEATPFDALEITSCSIEGCGASNDVTLSP